MKDRDIMTKDNFSKYVNGFVGYMDNLFNKDIQPSLGGGIRADITESNSEYIIEAEIAGFTKEDINIELVDDRLTISATREESTCDDDKDYIRRERRYGTTSRSFSVQGIVREE